MIATSTDDNDIKKESFFYFTRVFFLIKLNQLPPSFSPSLSPSPHCPIIFTAIPPLSLSPRVTAKKAKEV